LLSAVYIDISNQYKCCSIAIVRRPTSTPRRW